jgi:two-component system, NtrC family, sensor histidine kinase KinB
MSVSRSNMSTLLRAYLFLGSFVLVAAAFVYSYSWVRKVNQESQAVSRLLARFVALTALEAPENPEIKELFAEVIQPSDLPLILTEPAGRPMVWHNVGIDRNAIDIETISSWVPGGKTPAPPVLQRLLDKTAEFDRTHEPIPIYRRDTGHLFAYVHYGERRLASELRYIPLVQIGIIAVFIALGYVGYRSIRTSEERAIWIGLAKETAHQLGSPITSLMGLVELVRERVPEGDRRPPNGETVAGAPGPPGSAGHAEGVQVSLSGAFLADIVSVMEDDAERLNKIAKRFGQIGSLPRLNTEDVAPIVSAAVRYLRRRVPHLKKEIQIQERYEMAPPVNVNEELIEWVVENILKNAIDAIGTQGTIKVEVQYRREAECVEIWVTDDGKGMTRSEARQAFLPGYTTKGRGWGLGLTLAKRIVEDYHGGSIWIERTEPGRGTTFVVSFPV